MNYLQEQNGLVGTRGETKQIAYDFHESLAASHAAQDLPFWQEVYKTAFPNFQSMNNHREDGAHQRNGIDRSIVLSNGKCLWIDEKVRGRNRKTGEVYEDIALEYLSNRDRNIPGWVCKPLMCDYIAYAIAPLGRCYLLPVIQLQSAWQRCGETWKLNYPKKIEAFNRDKQTGYSWWTVSVGVPADVLYPQLGHLFRISFPACELEHDE